MGEREEALTVTGNKGVEPAMEWLLAHGDNIAAGSENVPKDTSVSEDVSLTNMNEEANVEAKSLQCDECHKKFRTDSEVEFHAVKTGHQQFSESAEAFKPLTAEEKQEQLKKVETIIKQRRIEKAEQEKREELEKEKTRRKTGQEITQVRQKMQEQEMKELAEQKRKEKLEAKLARQRVLDEIERDKIARREKFNMGTVTVTSPVATPAPQFTAPAPSADSYNECRLQIRLSNGECLTQTFGSKEELSAVRLYIQMNRTDGAAPFSLMTNFPKKVFSEEDMQASLCALGLVPSAVLIVTRPQ